MKLLFLLLLSLKSLGISNNHVEQLWKLPNWEFENVFGDEEFNQYIKFGLIFRTLPRNEQIEILSNYENKCTIQEFNGKTDYSSKPYILFRIIFNIEECNYRSTANWRGVTENPMWPIVYKDSKFSMISNYKGSRGGPYSAVEEFRILIDNCKLRNIILQSDLSNANDVNQAKDNKLLFRIVISIFILITAMTIFWKSKRVNK